MQLHDLLFNKIDINRQGFTQLLQAIQLSVVDMQGAEEGDFGQEKKLEVIAQDLQCLSDSWKEFQQVESELYHQHAQNLWQMINQHINTQVAEHTHQLINLNQELRQQISEYQERENILKQQQDFLHNIIDSIPSLIFVKDWEGRFIFVNQAMADIYNTKIEDLIGKTDADFNPNTAEVMQYLAADQEVMTTLQPKLITEETVSSPNGDFCYFQTIKKPLILPEGIATHVLGICIDITELKQVEKALQESEQLFRLMANTAPVFIWMTAADGVRNFFNDNWLEFTGRSQEQEINHGWTQGVHDKDIQNCLDTYLLAFRARKRFSVEYQLRRADGEYRWILDTGVPIFQADGNFAGYIGSCIDITDRKLAEVALQMSEHRYQTLAEISPVGIFHTDAMGDCFYVNQRWCEIAGLDAAAAQGLGWLEAIDLDDRGRIATEWYTAAQESLPFYAEYRFRRPDGKITWVLGQAIAQRESNGKLVGYVGTITDITERKQAELALKEQEELLSSITDNIPDGTAYRILIYPNGQLKIPYFASSSPDVNHLPTFQEDMFGSLYAEDKSYAQQAVWDALHGNGKLDNEYRTYNQHGEMRWMHTRAAIKLLDNNIVQMEGVTLDITERKRAQMDLQNLVEGAAAVTGDDFFLAVSKYIATALNVKYVVIAKLQDNYLQTRILLSDGEKQPNLPIFLDNGPCSRSLIEGQFFCSQGLQQQFPDNQVLSSLQVESYFGIALTNMQGDVIGSICILDPKPLTDTPRVRTILQIFAARVSAELERQAAMEALHHLNQELEARVEQRTKALQESQERWQLALRGSNDGIWDWNVKTNQVFFSSRWKEMRGFAEEEIGSQVEEWSSRIHPEDGDRILTAVTEHFAHKTPFFKEEYRVQRKDGSYMWVLDRGQALWDEAGNPIRMAGSETDITDRHQAEQELKRTLKELSDFKYALDQAALVVITDAEGIITYVNDQFCETSQYTRQELIGTTHLFVNPNYHSQDFFAQLWETVSQGQIWQGEIQDRKKNGSIYWVSTTIVPFVNQDDKPCQYVSIRHDITNRKLTEQQLHNREIHLRAAQRIARLGSWEFDVHTQQISWSEEVFDIFQRPTADGAPTYTELYSYIHPDDRLLHESTLQSALITGQSYEIEFRIYQIDNQLTYLQGRGEPIFNSEGLIVRFVGTVLDITDRKKAEAQLQSLTDRLTLAVKSGAIGIWEWDIENNTLIWDDRMYELYGIDKSDFTGKYQVWLNAIHPDDRHQAVTHIQQAVASEQEFDTDFRIIRPDGSICFIKAFGLMQRDKQNQPQRMIGINFDIGYRKKTEETLKQQLAAIEAAIDGIGILKGETYTYANQALLQLFGYEKPSELVGKNWRELYPTSEINRFEQEIIPVLMQQHSWQGEAIAIRKDGTTFTQGLSLTWTESKELICVCRNITEQKQAEQQIKQVNEQLALTNTELYKATRLKDEFLASMSHELRTPLNTILGMSEGLQEAVFGNLNDRQQNAIATIERSGKHLLELINDILDLSKIESGKLELQTAPIAVSYLCESSLTFIRQQAINKNIHLHLEIPPGLPDIVVDERRLRQVLINLLSNAVKFTPENGKIKLLVQTQQDKDRLLLCFSVIDTGIGISPTDMDKLFQPFVQIDSKLNRQHTGTGLGLSLVRRLVELHQGHVSVTSELGQGSCFKVCIPYVSSKESLTTIIPETYTVNTLSTVNSPALIIEDSVFAADQIVRYLGELNIETVVHTQGEGAVDAALRLKPKFLILDILLPTLSGWEVLKQIKANPQTQNIPVIAVSVVDEQKTALSLGAAEYLVKPITREQLRQAIEKIHHLETVVQLPTGIAPAQINNSPLILLAEDNEANIATFSNYLNAKGYHLNIAPDGESAVSLAKTLRPDLILMDIQMPGMDGLEAMRQIRADSQLETIPIIALTALAMPGDREKCLLAGANDYLTKPVRLKKLLETIQNFLHVY